MEDNEFLGVFFLEWTAVENEVDGEENEEFMEKSFLLSFCFCNWKDEEVMVEEDEEEEEQEFVAKVSANPPQC